MEEEPSFETQGGVVWEAWEETVPMQGDHDGQNGLKTQSLTCGQSAAPSMEQCRGTGADRRSETAPERATSARRTKQRPKRPRSGHALQCADKHETDSQFSWLMERSDREDHELLAAFLGEDAQLAKELEERMAAAEADYVAAHEVAERATEERKKMDAELREERIAAALESYKKSGGPNPDDWFTVGSRGKVVQEKFQDLHGDRISDKKWREVAKSHGVPMRELVTHDPLRAFHARNKETEKAARRVAQTSGVAEARKAKEKRIAKALERKERDNQKGLQRR